MGATLKQRAMKHPDIKKLNERIEYVLSTAIRLDLDSPFLEANWDQNAQDYLRTGEEKYKEGFPMPKQGNNLENLLNSYGSRYAADLRLEQIKSSIIRKKIEDMKTKGEIN